MAKPEHRCKDCRYWYGADPDASPSATGRRALTRTTPRVLSAPHLASGVRS